MLRPCLAGALVLAAAVTLGACGGRSRPPSTTPAPPAASSAPLRVATEHGVRSFALEEYVAGCVIGELGAGGAPRAGKDDAGARMRDVQAILCRSYAIASRGRHASGGFDVCATTHCQVYRPVPANAAGRLAREAAERTRGLVLVSDGRLVRPVYHAHCGGRTSAADEVWPGPGERWLVALKEDACGREAAWTFQAGLQRLGLALAADTRLALRLPLRDIGVERRDSAGRASLLRLQAANAVIIRGEEFRSILLKAFGARSLGSTRFSVSRRGRDVVFTGRGYGHGVGLCQAGALRLCAAGRPVAAILAHYYPGTRLVRLD